jgi:hypothetical protein
LPTSGAGLIGEPPGCRRKQYQHRNRDGENDQRQPQLDAHPNKPNEVEQPILSCRAKQARWSQRVPTDQHDHKHIEIYRNNGPMENLTSINSRDAKQCRARSRKRNKSSLVKCGGFVAAQREWFPRWNKPIEASRCQIPPKTLVQVEVASATTCPRRSTRALVRLRVCPGTSFSTPRRSRRHRRRPG